MTQPAPYLNSLGFQPPQEFQHRIPSQLRTPRPGRPSKALGCLSCLSQGAGGALLGMLQGGEWGGAVWGLSGGTWGLGLWWCLGTSAPGPLGLGAALRERAPGSNTHTETELP